jgi:hypothetical protein
MACLKRGFVSSRQFGATTLGIMTVSITTLWKRISHKLSDRLQHLVQLKACATHSLQRNLVLKKRNNLCLGLMTTSGG